MPPTARSLAERYGFALLAAAAALLARLALDPLLGDRLPFLFACVAVVAVAWHGGLGPSALALALGTLTVAYFFLPPRHALADGLAGHRVQVSGFLFLGVTIGLFSERLRAARRRAEAHAREALRQRQELEQEVTRRKRLEDELQRRAADLAEADRRKDEFLAVLSHELRNPLAALQNAVRAVRLRGHERREAVAWAHDMMERQVRHLTRLVDDLLDVARVSQGKVTLRKGRVDLAAIARQAAETLAPFIEARRHALDVALPAEPLPVEADPTRLAQVVANLLHNAAKYTPEGGHVRLGARREGGEVVLRVADDGIGISPETLPRLFDLFAQAEPGLEQAQGGLGIGLSLVKGLVELHGGTVEAQSAGPGKGSEFTVRLPVAECGVRSADSGDNPQPALRTPRSRRVLVVDDNADAAESLAMVLRLTGHEARTAHGAAEALRAAEEFRPEAVLLDLGLPGGVSGYDLAPRLRQLPGLEGALLVAVTGHGQEEDRRRSREAGFDAHLVKPADLDALQALLARGR